MTAPLHQAPDAEERVVAALAEHRVDGWQERPNGRYSRHCTCGVMLDATDIHGSMAVHLAEALAPTVEAYKDAAVAEALGRVAAVVDVLVNDRGFPGGGYSGAYHEGYRDGAREAQEKIRGVRWATPPRYDFDSGLTEQEQAAVVAGARIPTEPTRDQGAGGGLVEVLAGAVCECGHGHLASQHDSMGCRACRRCSKSATEALAPTVARLIEDAWPCENYRAPLTCLTAPSSETGRCDHCVEQAGAAISAALSGGGEQ